MSAFETSATVEEHGQIRLTGVPFDLGTRVDVVVTLAVNGADESKPSASRSAKFLAALDKARNSEPVGTLRRDELYDRNGLH